MLHLEKDRMIYVLYLMQSENLCVCPDLIFNAMLTHTYATA